MSWLARIIWLFWAKQALIREAKRKALGYYLGILRTARHSVIVLFAAFLVLQLMILSLVGAVVTGFYLWDHDFQAKMEILFWIFAGTFTVPAILLAILLSDFLWLRVSGAKRMMDSLTNR